MNDDDLSPAERKFMALRHDPEAFASWSTEVREQWEREHGVEWLHHRDGKPVWRRVRPTLDPDRSPQFRFNAERAAQYAAARAKSRPSMGDDPR